MKAIIFTDMAGYYGFGRAAGGYRIASEFRNRGIEIKVVDCFSSYTLEQIKTIISNYKTSETEWIGFSTTFLVNLDNYKYVDEEDDYKIRHKNQTVAEKEYQTATGMSQMDESELFSYINSLGLKVILGGYRVNSNVLLPDYVKSMYGPAETQFFPDFDFTNSQINYQEDDYINEGEDLPLEIARGCIFKCKFCFFPLNGKKLWEFVKSPETLREEMMRNYINYGTTGYMFADDTYNDSPEKIEELLKMYKTLPFDLRFSSYARLDLMISKPDTQEMLYESGLRSVFFGIETFNHTAGKFIGKGMDPDKVKRGLMDFREKFPDVLVYASMIGGLPTETLEEMEESYKFLTEEAKIHQVTWGPLFLNSGSDMSLNAEKYGYRKSANDKRGWVREDGLSSLDVHEWCVGKKPEHPGHPGSWVFFNRLRNVGYSDEEIVNLDFKKDMPEIMKRSNVARENYIKKIL